MPPELTIRDLPPPPRLALPLAADMILQVSPGERVSAGQTLATGARLSADLIAPLAGVVTGLARKPLASGGQAQCLMLEEIAAAAPVRLAADRLPRLLKRAGIVGLGGAAFPAWRKWRRQLRWFIVNGLETEEGALHDAAQIAAAGEALPALIARVAAAFAAAPLLVLPAAAAPRLAHAMIRRLPPAYALGNDRLLAAELCGLRLPPAAVPADYGAVCFNVSTVLAMAAAIDDGLPLRSRLLTVHHENGKAEILRVPLGLVTGDLRRHYAACAPLIAGGADEQREIGDESVITAATTILRFGAPPLRAAALPCIQCGACAPVCPADLSPQHLYRLAQDGQTQEMKTRKLMHCLECRRCDAACPSNIPLTATFIQNKKRLRAETQAQAQTDERRRRFDRRNSRLSAAPPRLDRAALRRRAQAAQQRSAVGGSGQNDFYQQ